MARRKRRRRRKGKKSEQEQMAVPLLTTAQLDQDVVLIYGGQVHASDEKGFTPHASFRLLVGGYSLGLFTASLAAQQPFIVVSEDGVARHAYVNSIEPQNGDSPVWVELLFLTGKQKKSKRGKKRRRMSKEKREARKQKKLERKLAREQKKAERRAAREKKKAEKAAAKAAKAAE